MRRLVESILDDARVQPGIRSVSASNGLPFGFWFNVDAMSLTTPDRASEPPASPAWSFTRAIAVTPRFFTTAGLRLTHGRGFNEQDGPGAPAVAIVTEEFARETFRTTDVVGRSLVTRTTVPLPGSDRTRSEVGSISIVGVSADDEPWRSGRPKSLVFVPFAQRYQPYAPIAFLADGMDARAGVAALRASIRRVDPSLSISAAGTGAVLLEGPLFLLHVITAIAAALGGIGLVLAMSGLFGVLSHVVAKRTREMGIRIAVGADRADIVGLVLRDGLHPVGKGLLLGLGIGAASRIAVKAFIATEVSAIDPWPLVLLPIPFVLAAIAACYIPAARASRVDPTVALRDL
jgi:hypothetical protein